MSSYINCCPIPTRANNTNIKAWLTGLPAPDAACGAALSAGSIPLPRDDNGAAACWTTPGSCGSNGMGIAPWPAPYPAQTFAAGAPLMSNLCATGRGFKVVQSKKYWNGRYGFISDYVANPKVDTKYKSYRVHITLDEQYEGTEKSFDGSGTLINFGSGSGSGSHLATSNQTMSAGGIVNCIGEVLYSDGSGQWTQDGIFSYYFTPQSALGGSSYVPIVINQTGFPEIIAAGINTSTIATNKTKLKALCGINSYRAIMTAPFPWGTGVDAVYIGPASGFAAWLSGFNINSNTAATGSGIYTVQKIQKTFTLFGFELTDTSLRFSISCEHLFDQKDYTGDESGPINDHYLFRYTGIFTGEATLSDAYTSAQCQADAVDLLKEWDMTNDTVYPWRTDSNCGVAPMVIRKEVSTAPGWGYCDTPADSNSTTKFDGTIYGAPMADVGIYNPGWFDFYADQYNYSPDPFGGVQLCYTYGQYAPDYLPTMSTHWTDGALDTSDRAGWAPFSRFKYSYIYNLPPFVNHGCAFVENNQEAFWASKWAETKEPLPSQNYTAPCGPQPNQCAIDDHGGAFGDCALMSSLYELDANCQPTATLRYPGAPSSCSVDLSPKGYYVRSVDYNGALSAQEGNVKPIGRQPGIIAILPPGSPELGKWPAVTTNFYTDYPSILPTEHWYSAVQQAMSDRFWIDGQDAKVSDEVAPDPACAIKNKDGSPCTSYPCDPVLTPLVEARLYAPAGAALQFLTDQHPQWNKMPGQSDWGTTCSAVWSYGQTAASFTAQPGVATNYADSLNTTGISSDTDAGWGLADSLFIP